VQSAQCCPGPGKLAYRCSGHWREDHGQPLFGVSVNSHIQEGDPVVFATVGFNRVTVYEADSQGDVRLVQCYADPDPEENFYSCAWSYDPDTRRPVLAAGGARGIVRLFSPASMACVRNFIGHGNAINEVKFHPVDPNLLLSVSKDHALRLWNVKTEHNIAIFGGVEGHRDEVLSADFNLDGTRIVSAGMDHSLKIWQFDTDALQDAIALSYKHDTLQSRTVFPTELCHFPDFSTRDIHRNYVDCCRWLGEFVLSKSCENTIVCWKAGGLEPSKEGERPEQGRTTVIHRLDVRDCEIWFIRFATDSEDKVLALGNTKGKIYTWDLTVTDPAALQHRILSHPKCTSAVRQTSLSRDGEVLIAVCDDGTIWRWDRV
jgi:polycomb protein EED